MLALSSAVSSEAASEFTVCAWLASLLAMVSLARAHEELNFWMIN